MFICSAAQSSGTVASEATQRLIMNICVQWKLPIYYAANVPLIVYSTDFDDKQCRKTRLGKINYLLMKNLFPFLCLSRKVTFAEQMLGTWRDAKGGNKVWKGEREFHEEWDSPGRVRNPIWGFVTGFSKYVRAIIARYNSKNIDISLVCRTPSQKHGAPGKG